MDIWIYRMDRIGMMIRVVLFRGNSGLIMRV